MSEHYTRAEDVPRLTAAWIEEFMQVSHADLAAYAAEMRHNAHDAKCVIEELRDEVSALRDAASWREELQDAQRYARDAIDELRRWQYSNDVADIRHSIDMATRILERI